MPQKLLKLLIENPRLTNTELAKILNQTPKQIENAIQKLQKNGDLIGFQTIVNPNKKKSVLANIEIRLQTIRGSGFDQTAERIAHFPEVESVTLISGNHDLNVTVRGPNLKKIAEFVHQKIATLANVRGTTTHFVLKKYKENNLILQHPQSSTRPPVSA